MPRWTLITLICLTMAGLSCEQPRTQAEDLPSVSAPPPMDAAAPQAGSADEQLVAAVAAHIGARGRTGMTESEIAQLARTIVEESRRHTIDPGLVLAVIHVESRYGAYVVSPVGAMGLMQILPSTGEELAAREGIIWRGPQTLFDPIVNVRLGVAYLKELTDRYGNTTLALAAYNWGPGRIDRRLRRGTPMPKVYPALVFEAYTAHREASS
jgi:soluble lytic murein transglycosylase-like protein